MFLRCRCRGHSALKFVQVQSRDNQLGPARCSLRQWREQLHDEIPTSPPVHLSYSPISRCIPTAWHHRFLRLTHRSGGSTPPSSPLSPGQFIPVDQFKSQKHAVERKLASLPGVAGAYLTLVCCTHDRKSILYVGIEEGHPLPKVSTRSDRQCEAQRRRAECWQRF